PPRSSEGDPLLQHIQAGAPCTNPTQAIEFLMDENRNYFFLEMNTRLQVEHSVTELTTGVDLVKTQLLVAMGERLPFSQSELEQRGHAIEVRIYAEDPASGFLPSTGTIAILDVPNGVQIRNDLGIAEGQTVSLFYDPLLAKLTVAGASRADAVQRMGWALHKYSLAGVRTNLTFLRAVVQHPAFQRGETDTGFIERYLPDWKPVPIDPIPDEVYLLAALKEALSIEKYSSAELSESSLQNDPFSPWRGGV
ncbi:MAG: 3-methylcrotonyl-CoA carboxylase, partial [bacterium]|nr:3-methylcrotonyl-CoA carboxylase [bacterium]